MAGLIESHKRMKTGNISPVIHAAAIAYGFVFLHPFEDGNERIHRFLIHNILSLKKTIQDIIDMPDRLIDLFIQLCLQNNGSLSARNKASHFDFLTDEELFAMEQAVRDGYNRPD